MTKLKFSAATLPKSCGSNETRAHRRRYRSDMKFIKAARPVIMGRNCMGSSRHYRASLAGVQILKEGGNAVDAALAAGFVMSIVKPETSGPGGDLFALVYMKKNGKVEAINSSGPAPAKATIENFHDRGLKAIPQFGP